MIHRAAYIDDYLPRLLFLLLPEIRARGTRGSFPASFSLLRRRSFRQHSTVGSNRKSPLRTAFRTGAETDADNQNQKDFRGYRDRLLPLRKYPAGSVHRKADPHSKLNKHSDTLSGAPLCLIILI